MLKTGDRSTDFIGLSIKKDTFTSLTDPSIHTETDLVQRLKKGEEAAYSYLYDHYSSALFGIILQIIPKKEIAKEILQDVFVKVYQKIEQYDSSKGRLYTWLLQVARNTAIDRLRSKGYKKARKIRPLYDDVNQSNLPVSDFPFMDHLGLEKALATLDKSHQKIIDLAYFKGYTQKEIADELDMPLGTVKTRTRNALIQLRKVLNIT